MSKTKRVTLSGLFLGLGMVLPFLTGQIPEIGGMLLDEYSCKDNGGCQNKRGNPDSFSVFKMFTFGNGNMCTNGIVNMDTGPKIGRSICFPKGGNHLSKNVVAGKFFQSQVMSIGPKRGNH